MFFNLISACLFFLLLFISINYNSAHPDSLHKHENPSPAPEGLILWGGFTESKGMGWEGQGQQKPKEIEEKSDNESEERWREMEGGESWSKSQVTATQKQWGGKSQMLEPINSFHMF